MEDIRFRPEGCIFKTTMELPFDVEGEKAVLKQYAKLHAQFWRNAPKNIWRRCPKTGLNLGNTPPRLRVFSDECYKGLLERFDGKVTIYDDVKDAIALVLSDYDKLFRYCAEVANTMIHGDSHMGNIFLSGNRSLVGFVDFQCVAEANSIHDIAYHLIFSCPTEVLTQHEEMFIRFYLQELHEALLHSNNPDYAKEVPSYEEAVRLYRVHAIHALLAALHILGLVKIIADDFSTTLLRRCVEACHRLRCNEILEEVL